MVDSDKIFAGSIPEIYDTYLVPLIFDRFAEDLAARAFVHEPKEILEVAAGSGTVTRALAPKLAKEARLTVTDLNQPMLDYAKRRQDPDERLVWQQADALALPFPDKGFDAIVCQFGVMFFPDRIKGYREARRVLKDGGSYHFNVWDRIETNEFAHVVTEAVASHFPDDPPLFLARAPHGYHDTDLIHQELEIAGFSHITITTMEIDSIGATARHPAIAYCQGTPLRLEIESRNASVEEITEKVAVAVAARFGKGPVTGKIRGHVVEAK